ALALGVALRGKQAVGEVHRAARGPKLRREHACRGQTVAGAQGTTGNGVADALVKLAKKRCAAAPVEPQNGGYRNVGAIGMAHDGLVTRRILGLYEWDKTGLT